MRTVGELMDLLARYPPDYAVHGNVDDLLIEPLTVASAGLATADAAASGENEETGDGVDR